ncbi:NAD(P)-dependent oxidoreductase [Schleiferiaceae bacterium]|nr:NAD(P)-dependent oxidoreductase [Schleiferiaceae bacterium]
MKKILVFGGHGFLGYYLVQELLKRGYDVTVSDIHENERLESETSYVQCDITCRSNVENVFENKQFDIVYNLAGFANLDAAIKHPIETIQINVIGNMYILEECVKNNVTRFVYASSAYAMSSKGSFYGISKLASEKIVEEYLKKHSLPFTILRYGSVYSEKSYDNNYIYNLVKCAVLDGEINHNGDGNELREYIHAADASKLSVDVIESEDFKNLHVILTGNDRMKRSDLFDMVKEILNDQVAINYTTHGYHNHYNFTPYSFEPSVSRKLTANPHIDMGQGLLECVRSVYRNEK